MDVRRHSFVAIRIVRRVRELTIAELQALVRQREGWGLPSFLTHSFAQRHLGGKPIANVMRAFRPDEGARSCDADSRGVMKRGLCWPVWKTSASTFR